VAAVAEEGVVEAGDLGIGNVVHASFQILHSEIHALNVMAQKVVVEVVEEAATVGVTVVAVVVEVEDIPGTGIVRNVNL